MLVKIDYTNWKGERSIRLIIPIKVEYEANDWHAEPQWLLHAFDVDRDARRMFALSNIHSWQGVKSHDGADTSSRAHEAGAVSERPS